MEQKWGVGMFKFIELHILSGNAQAKTEMKTSEHGTRNIS
jgi:hypothetical protein